MFDCKYFQFSTAVVDDSTNPEYNEEFIFRLTREELVGKVLKLSLADHDGGGAKKVIVLNRYIENYKP